MTGSMSGRPQRPSNLASVYASSIDDIKLIENPKVPSECMCGCSTDVVCRRETDTGARVQSRYYVNSLDGSAEWLLMQVRAHWSIEHSLQWSMDVMYHQDRAGSTKATVHRTWPHYGKFRTSCSSGNPA